MKSPLLSRLPQLSLLFAFTLSLAVSAQAQTFTELADFDYTDGYVPYARLVQGTNGNFYGTTEYGGPYDESGNAFEITHVTDDYKLMTLADLFHNFEEEIAGAGSSEKGTALITTGGNKVRVSSAVVAMQVCRH
jgi:hypothetical protein